MASYAGMAATSEAIVSLLERALPGSEFAGAPVRLYRSGDFAAPMNEGVSLYLHRIDLNTSRRNAPWRLGDDGRRYRAALPLDLHYLLTAWGSDPVKQQRLLGWATRVLHDTPVIPAGLLNHAGPEAGTFGSDEQIELVWEALPHADLSEIWDVAKANRQPSATYLARSVEIESKILLEEATEVQVRDLGFGQEFDRVGEGAPR
ncbi:MAG TPA: DUF4255 domain-containing protein [Solirubrobacterales bacterium]